LFLVGDDRNLNRKVTKNKKNQTEKADKGNKTEEGRNLFLECQLKEELWVLPRVL